VIYKQIVFRKIEGKVSESHVWNACFYISVFSVIIAMKGLENRSHPVFVLKGARNPFCSFNGENLPKVPKMFVKNSMFWIIRISSNT
jgi:hypothetical protein